MGKEKTPEKIQKKLDSKTKQSRRQKGAIIGLTIALLLAGGAAVATPLILMSQNKGNAKTYTVTFKAGKGVEDIKQEVVEGKLATEPATPVVNDQKVKQWKKPDGKVWNFKEDKVTADITLTAEWEDVPPSSNYHTVTYKVDETVYKTLAVKDQETAMAPEAPTKAGGFKFSEWQKDGKAFDFRTPITEDITLTAKFDPVPVVTWTVTYHVGEHGKFVGSTRTTETRECVDLAVFSSISKPEVESYEGYTFIGWVDAQGNELNAVKVTENMAAYAKYSEAQEYVNLSLSSETISTSYEVEVKGTDTYTWNKKDNKTFGSIKKGLPIAVCTDKTSAGDTFEFVNWSKIQQTDFTTQNPEPASTDLIGKEDVLYPQFKKLDKLHTITLTLELTGDQKMRSGTKEIQVSYRENSEAKTFGEITKPEIYDGNKSFEGYYHDSEYKDPWLDSEKIDLSLTKKSIYIQMTAPKEQPSINFIVEDAGHESEYKWVGNHEDIRCAAKTKLSNVSIPNVYYKDAVADPDPTIGFKSDWYFKNWAYKNEEGNLVDITNTSDFIIENSIDLIARFEKKTLVSVVTNDTTDPTKYTRSTFYAMPTSKWGDVVKPEVTTTDPSTRFLTGWSTKDTDGTDITLTKDTCIQDILLKTGTEFKETIDIVPIISDQVHKITFDNIAKVEGSDKTHETFLKGNLLVGVVKTNTTKVNKEVNKPALPLSDNGVATKNNGITFENQWQIKGPSGSEFEDWTDVDDDTIIPASDTPVEYTMRPVVKLNVDITYNAGTGGKISGSSTVSVGTNKAFSEIYKPDIIANDGLTFDYWAKIVDGKPIRIGPKDTFDVATELVAQYTTNKVDSIIRYHTAEIDLNDTDFPATPVNEENEFEVVKTHLPSEHVTIADFADRRPTKKKHHFSGWGTLDETTGKVNPIPTSTVVVPGTALHLYAMFEPDSVTYHKVTIKENPEEYTIEGQSTFFIGHDECIDITAENDIVIERDDEGNVISNVYAWTVGKNLVGWKDSEGNAITNTTPITADMEDIEPVFEAPAQQPEIKFVTGIPGFEPEGASIVNPDPRFIPVNDTLSKYLAGEVSGWTPATATKPKSTFTKWTILNKDGLTTSEITANTRVTNDLLTNGVLTLVATFIDESIYEGIDGAYYYDEELELWGAIQSYFYDGDTRYLKVQFQDGIVRPVDKSTFNYEVKFGTLTKSIPDYFMYGCSAWDNGEQPLKFPSTIQSIGKNVMYGCTSFNQPITSTINLTDLPTDPSESKNHVFTIGENFMKNCYAFDNDLKLDYTGSALNAYLIIGEGFMSECQDLGKTSAKTLDFTGWTSLGLFDTMTSSIKYIDSLSEANFYNCLSTTKVDPYTINIIVNSWNEAAFTTAFSSLDDIEKTPYHRVTNITVKGS